MAELDPKVRFETDLHDVALLAVQDTLDRQPDDGWIWLSPKEVADQVGERYDEMDVVRSPDGKFYEVEVDVLLHRLEPLDGHHS